MPLPPLALLPTGANDNEIVGGNDEGETEGAIEGHTGDKTEGTGEGIREGEAA